VQAQDFCRDVDECATGEAKCEEGTYCENILASYQCVKKLKKQCPNGFMKVHGRCLDKNECRTNNPCQPIIEQCVNTVGSYKCVRTGGKNCPKGYRYDGSGCTDKNECIENKNICNGIGERCINILGSYQCACKYGFRAHPITKQCEDVDECSGKRRRCAHKCFNTIGGYQCACNTGFILHRNKVTCNDVNECNRPDACKNNEYCVNSKGTFVCLPKECPKHYQLMGQGTCVRVCSDGQDCTDLPYLIRTFVRARSKAFMLRLPISIDVRKISSATGFVDFTFKQGNEKNLFKIRKLGKARMMITSTKPNFTHMDPFSVKLVVLGVIHRNQKVPVKFEYHLMLNFY